MVIQKCTLKLYTRTLEAHLNLLKTNNETNKISNRFEYEYNELFGIKNYYHLKFHYFDRSFHTLLFEKTAEPTVQI